MKKAIVSYRVSGAALAGEVHMCLVAECLQDEESMERPTESPFSNDTVMCN